MNLTDDELLELLQDLTMVLGPRLALSEGPAGARRILSTVLMPAD